MIITGERRDISIHASREGGDFISKIMSAGLSISIHASREGGDWQCHEETKERKKFQSTPPVREATRSGTWSAGWKQISIHASREGGDPC